MRSDDKLSRSHLRLSISTGRYARNFFAGAILLTVLHGDVAQSAPSGEQVDTTGVDTSVVAPWRKGVTKTQRATALLLLKQGNHFHERLQYSQALTYYRKALKHWNHPAIQFNMADCYINMDQPLPAYHAIRASLRFGRGPLSVAQYKQANNYQKLLRARLAEITVETKQPGVQITLDGKPFFKGPGVKRKLVVPGEHQVVGMKAKYVTHTSKLSVFSSKKVRVRVHLTSVASLTKNRKVIYKRRWKTWMPWTVFAAGVAVAGVGVPLLFKARGDVDAFDTYVDTNCAAGCEKSDFPVDIVKNNDQSKYLNATSIGLMVAGGATLVTAVVLLILNRAKAVVVEAPSPKVPKPTPPGVQIVPSVGPGGASVSAQFRF